MLYEELCEDIHIQDEKVKKREYKIEYKVDNTLDENKEMENEYYCPFKVNDFVSFFNDETVWRIKSITTPTSTKTPSTYADLESYLNGDIMKNVIIYNHFMRARFVNFIHVRDKLRGHSFGFGFNCSVC